MISMQNVTKIYENGALGLKDFSIEIEKGEFVFVVGSSGSGKSTFIRTLLKEIEPTTGEVYIDSTQLSVLKRKKVPYLRRKIGCVFQDFRLLPSKTVYDNVAFAMQVIEASNRSIRRSVPQTLSLVGLHKKANAYPDQLSGGEKQRVAIARAVINKPPILIADEPTGNLDPDTAWEIMELLKEINSRGTTVVMATHAKDIVNKMRKRVIHLDNCVLISDVEEGGYNDEA
ncbi:MAG: cell division ATP-binding protein FtsE [Clostridiales bacterium]|nr:cell division ATP-binding protein FtsE [Clostridiales bacterium]